MTGTPGGYRAEVAAYAAAVRQHLVGLSDEDVDDLTDDLEADLADALADEGLLAGPGTERIDLTARFGDPEAYARELRAAAGLPDAAPDRGPSGLRGGAAHVAAGLRAGRERVRVGLDAQPWWPPLRDFLLTMRPAWWVLRAWVGYQVVVHWSTGRSHGWLPSDLLPALLLGALVVVSVQWGRRRWLPGKVAWLGALASVLAVVALLPSLVWADASSYRIQTQFIQSPGGGYVEVPENGVVVDRMLVSNLFVYDAEGNPLDDVQIYDDRGRPVRTTYDEGQQTWSLPGVTETWSFIGAVDVDGRTRWNVYPLRGAPSDSLYPQGVATPLLPSATRIPPRPFAKAPAIVLDDDAASTTGTADAADDTAGSATPSADGSEQPLPSDPAVTPATP